MNVRHGLAAVLTVTVALRVACCLAEDRVAEATLGPAEPIGSLQFGLVVRDSPDPEPQLGQPILLAALDVPVNFLPAAASDPGEIQQHLLRTAELLGAAGLTDDAVAVESILRNFESKHRDRLALARKWAELARLQDEIAQLSLRVGDGVEAAQVEIEVRVDGVTPAGFNAPMPISQP